MIVYSLEFRQTALSVRNKEGLSYKETAKRFGVSPQTIFRWYRATPEYITARPLNKEILKKNIKKYPEISQRRRAKMLGVSQPSISYWIRKILKDVEY
jgi:transposase